MELSGSGLRLMNVLFFSLLFLSDSMYFLSQEVRPSAHPSCSSSHCEVYPDSQWLCAIFFRSYLNFYQFVFSVEETALILFHVLKQRVNGGQHSF